MKRGPQHFDAVEPRLKHQQLAASPSFMCAKLLISAKEASSVLGPGGSTCREIGQQTGTKLHLSSRHEFYPGTNLQELAIKGPSADAVANALMQVLGTLAEETGRISCGESDVEEGGARVRFVIPVSSAKALIGRGGENIKALRAGSGLYVHIEEVAIGAGEAAEQIVSFQGSLAGIQVALPNVIEKIAAFAMEPWFAAWAATSHAGSDSAVATQVAPGKAGGKGKGAYRHPPQHMKGWHDGWGRGDEVVPYGGVENHYRAAPNMHMDWSSAAESAGMELIAGAIQTLPPSMLNPADRSQKVAFHCPASCVSAIIGKGGAGVKEIAAATQTKIMIREIEDNALEQMVTILGSAVGVVAAYLHLAGRIACVEEMMGGSGVEASAPGTLALPG